MEYYIANHMLKRDTWLLSYKMRKEWYLEEAFNHFFNSLICSS